jgi:hypothetical protein
MLMCISCLSILERIESYIPLDTMDIDHLYHLNFRPEMNVDNTESVVYGRIGDPCRFDELKISLYID